MTPNAAFDGANIALLVGARPRGPGMERGDLLAANGGIFGPQGAAINARGGRRHPRRRGGQSREHERAHRRGTCTGCPARAVHRAHAPRSQPRPGAARRRRRGLGRRHPRPHDLGQSLGDAVPRRRTRDRGRRFGARAARGAPRRARRARDSGSTDDFIPRVAKRGAEIIEVRGSSSVASAASATIDHVRDWVGGTPDGWTSAAVVSDGSYGVPEGLISSFPVSRGRAAWQIVQGLSRRRVRARAASTRPWPSSKTSARRCARSASSERRRTAHRTPNEGTGR